MRLLILSVLSLVFISCNNKEKKTPVATTKPKKVYYPYSAYQTSNFEMGNPEHVKTVLDVWRAYDRGNLTPLKESFALQITFMFPDQFMQGQKDTVLAQWQKSREAFTDVQTYIDSWVPLYAPDTKEYFVLVWARRHSTQPDGKVLNRTIHEKWRVNQLGKIDFMQHYVNESY
jgi:hypothetical protein